MFKGARFIGLLCVYTLLMLLGITLFSSVYHHKVRIDALEKKQREFIMFTAQTAYENVDRNEQFKKHIDENFKYLKKKVDRALIEQKNNILEYLDVVLVCLN
jgi:hypothetical protein